MDITRSNFRKMLPEIEDSIMKCSFMAIDGEFTGLSSGLESQFSAFDTPAEYYKKLKSGSLDFLFIQFGLAAFIYDEQEQKYSHKTYNFYLFPRPVSKQAPDCRFMCQASSLDFLVSNGFDFNKLFNEGIPYLNLQDENTMRIKLEEAKDRKKSFDQNNSFVECPAEHFDSVNKAVISIVEFLSSDSDIEELTLPQSSAFVRKLIYQEVWKKYTQDDLRIETKNGLLTVKRPLTNDEKKEDEIKRSLNEKQEFEDAIGFSVIIKLIAQSRKLIVGHNMLLDLCHIINRFCQPLPDSYLEFKELLHTVFPYVLDTKYMCSTKPLVNVFPSSVLPHVLATVSKAPFYLLNIESDGEHGYSTLDDKHHEAGYDAYITGVIAISLSHYIAKDKCINLTPERQLPSSSSSHLKKFINKLILMKVTDTCVDLEKNDPEPDRDAVFHVTFPNEWKSSDIINMFSPYGGIQISWLTKNSAYCGLNDKSQAPNVLRHLSRAPPKGVTVFTYSAFHQLPLPIKRRFGERNCPSPPYQQITEAQKSRTSLKRPSVESIPEESETDPGSSEDKTPMKKRRKTVINGENTAKNKQPKLFEESEDW